FVPAVDDGGALFCIGAGANGQGQAAMVEGDAGATVFLDDVKQVAAAPDVVAFALNVLARGFACLRAQLVLLVANPAEAGNGVSACDLDACTGGRDKGDAACRGMHGQVDVLDGFARYLDGEVAELDRFGHL